MSSLLRNATSRLPPPPPSPIPTGKGSRSAANEVLTEYLDKSLKIPFLRLPEPHIQLNDDDAVCSRNTPDFIGYRLLESGDYVALNRLLRSAREFGAFMIIDHDIVDHHDLGRSCDSELDRVFCESERKNSDIQHITWARSSDKRVKCEIFSQKMEKIASKLDAIAELLARIFVDNIARMQFGKTIRRKESVLTIYRYSNKHNHVGNQFSRSAKSSNCTDHTLCLHLPAVQSRFVVKSASGPSSFVAGADTIIVTVGQRIEEWSMGDFKSLSGELVCEPHLEGNQPSFSIELKYSSLNLDHSSDKNCNIVTIRDQIVIMILIVFLYKIIVFVFS